jgi:hypothetical protein
MLLESAHSSSSLLLWFLIRSWTCPERLSLVLSLYYFFVVVVVIRYETAAAAHWASTFIVRIFVNDTITVAVWTGFHVCPV